MWCMRLCSNDVVVTRYPPEAGRLFICSPAMVLVIKRVNNIRHFVLCAKPQLCIRRNHNNLPSSRCQLSQSQSSHGKTNGGEAQGMSAFGVREETKQRRYV